MLKIQASSSSEDEEQSQQSKELVLHEDQNEVASPSIVDVEAESLKQNGKPMQ